MNATNATDHPTSTYTPGYARQKALVLVFGLILLVLGAWQLWTPLRLMAFGVRTQAEATDVVKAKAGLPDLVLKDNAQVLANQETRDRTYTFWNDFSFHTADGRLMSVRTTVGSQLKPIYPLLDSDGLATTDTIYYDATHPEIVVFPGIISSWFAPGMLVFVGLLSIVIGSVLLYWANKPIELPHIPSPAKEPSGA